MNNEILDTIIKKAIAEDIGDGDHSSLSCIPESAKGKAQLLIKQDGILAGIEIAKRVFNIIDDSLSFEQFLFDGNEIHTGDRAFIIEGKIHSILQAERLVLNIMQRMSGIATVTKMYANKLVGTKAKILDTRKTTPGLRYIEKLAVKIGGGENHRMGLFDMIMLKDNHGTQILSFPSSSTYVSKCSWKHHEGCGKGAQCRWLLCQSRSGVSEL